MNKVSVEIDSKVNELFAKTNVIQKFKNQSEEPLELKIYIYKNANLIFSSFNAKIGDSIKVQSKVIKKEKAEIKYTDSISSGNAAIFVAEDPSEPDRIIINMGNIPANEEVLFESEFIQFVESSKSCEFEIFRNLPIFTGKYDDDYYQNKDLKGKINIETNNKIIKLEKDILMKELKINEEKYLNEDKNNYLISYEIGNLPEFKRYKKDNYIPSSKIYFELDMNTNSNEPIVYCQKSLKNKDELNYVINYTNKTKETNENLSEINPALFIFLIDQSGSMSGSSIKIASKGLKLFLQSLPSKSYYQIIGFGSNYKAYDERPKEYTQDNIVNSIKIIDNLRANLGGTDIYSPLRYVYDSYKIHDEINLPRNIFLLTDGEIEDKQETLDLIYKNSSKYHIYSIGIGDYFDEDLIKNAGIIGKGGYNFCKNLDLINSIIVKEIKNAVSPFCSNINFKSSLDDINLIKNKPINIMRNNETTNLNYIINNKENNNKINVELTYLENKEKIEKKYDLVPKYLPEGDELSKLIINKYLNDNNLEEEEETKLELKYQIFRKNTSLFAEIELSDKVTGKMKEEILGNKENNQIKIKVKNSSMNPMFNYNSFSMMNNNMGMNNMMMNNIGMNNMMMNNNMGMGMGMMGMNPMMCMNYNMMGSPMMNSPSSMNNMMGSPMMNSPSSMNNMMMGSMMNSPPPMNNMMMGSMMNSPPPMNNMMMGNMMNSPPPMNNYNSLSSMNKMMDQECKKQNISLSNNKEEEKLKKIDLSEKDEIMKIINTQDFVNGFWEVNNYTDIIKIKYKKEYDLLKGIKNNFNDKVAITILIIFFINKEHPELLDELLMIITKAKMFIRKETNNTYENIIKENSFN